MKVVLAGAFGNLGAEILKSLCAESVDFLVDHRHIFVLLFIYIT